MVEQKVVRAQPRNGVKSHDDKVIKPTSLSLADDGFASDPTAQQKTALLDGTESRRLPTIVDDDGAGYKPTSTPILTDNIVLADEETPGDASYSGPFRVYSKRWFILCVVSLLNCSNTMSWIGYAPASNFVDCFYGKSTATWLSLVFLIAAIPVAFLAMWSVRRFGLRLAVLLAAWTNGIGALVRLVSTWIPPPAGQYVVLIGQCLAAIAYPFIMFLPTKVAASWFAGSQRATATMIAAMSNPLGVLFANMISPQLVVQKSDVVYLNILLAVVPTAAIALATFGVRTSDPPTPPGRAATKKAAAFWPGIKKCMTSRAFVTLLLALGGGIGMFNALYTMMQQLLCARGYSNSFAGVCCILMIVGGLCGATASAKFVDKTKRFEETMKVSFGIAVIGGVCFSLLALRPNVNALIAICCAAFGFFGLAAYPIGLETGAECTYPVAETTSTGLIVLSGQIQGALYILLMTYLGKPLTNPVALAQETCSIGHEVGSDCGRGTVQAEDMTVAMMIFASVAATLALIFICLFNPRLKRTAMETTGKAMESKKRGVGGRPGPGQNGDTANKIVEMKVIRKGKQITLSPDEPLVAKQ